ncbi:unnamed protein product [Caenorhabditis bovis]|uniref:Uncharacterized protein n=1 Tax=Caenorhabditis bovis TaxID=2654633 RepID=A0A8S1ELX7_9PELO|nr:unnamed protein product [Caenorhabditis bovis]
MQLNSICLFIQIIFVNCLPDRNSFSSAIAHFLSGDEQPKSVTASVIKQRIETGRVVLLICSKVCAKHRSEIPQWIKEFNQRYNYEIPEHISYYYHTYRQPVSFINESEIVEFPNLIYFIERKTYVFNGQVSSKRDVNEWLQNMDNVRIMTINTYDSLNNILSGTSNCSNKYLLLGSNKENCPQESWPIVARIAFNYGIQPIRLEMPLEPLSHVLLFKRLPTVIQTSCHITVLLYENNYSDLNDEILPIVVADWIKYLLPEDEGKCPALLDPYWFPIGDELTELEQIYFTAELEITERNKRPAFVLVGLAGGLAVIVLAYSIFWGLNGSAFAK